MDSVHDTICLRTDVVMVSGPRKVTTNHDAQITMKLRNRDAAAFNAVRWTIRV